MLAIRERLNPTHLAILEKLDANHRELLAALDRQATRINAFESGLARVDERTRKCPRLPARLPTDTSMHTCLPLPGP